MTEVNAMPPAVREKCVAEMRKFYYDPAKHKTYLDQLGIEYPTIR